jgi:hypothetical protein
VSAEGDLMKFRFDPDLEYQCKATDAVVRLFESPHHPGIDSA